MPRIVLSLANWQAVAHELEGTHTETTPPVWQSGCARC